MKTTIGCPIPGASQPKEPARLIDIKEVLQYDGAHFTWSGGRNCLTEQKAAYARGYNAGMKFIVDEAKKAPIIDPETLRPTAHWDGKATKYVDGVLVYDVRHCSKCGYTIDDGTDNENDLPNYCTHCGARMVNADE